MRKRSEVELLGSGWVQIVDCKYVERSDDNTRKVTIRISEISEIVSYEPRSHCHDMCKIVMSNGGEYNVCCNYDVLVELLCGPIKKEDKPIEGHSRRAESPGYNFDYWETTYDTERI